MFRSHPRAWSAVLLLGAFPCARGDAAPAVPPTGVTLTQVIEEALKHNPGLQTFPYRLRAVDARARQASLRPAPSLDLELENVLGTGDATGFDTAEGTFAFSQVIELGDKRGARVGVATAERGTIEIEREAAQLDVLAEVTRRFIGVAQRQEELQLARAGVALAEETVTATRKRVDVAKSPHAELDRAEIARDRARLVASGLEMQLDAARRRLAATWGASEPTLAGQTFGAVQADLLRLPPIGDFKDLSARIAENPDLVRFAHEARLRDAEIRLAQTLQRPDLTLSAGFRRLEAERDQAFVFSVSIPLFASQRAASFIDEAQAHRDRVDADRRVDAVRIEATLYELHRELQRFVLQARSLRDDIVPRSQEALHETEYAYARGRFGYLELVDAQREFLSVRAALIEAAAAAHTLRAEIERLTHAPLTEGTP
jgi:cobalt-zinc-cadmium efflux system outer membrane protein